MRIDSKAKVNNTDLLLNLNPKSMFSESIKNIRTSLAFSEIDKKMKIILVTSPNSGDGKSFISANLAVAYSQEKKRVLIIDADLRKGRQNEIFGIMNKSSGGYSNLILNYQKESSKEKFNIKEYIVKTSVNNLDLLPNGPTPPNPVELLSSKSNARLLNELKRFYDIIIIDCPPILGLSDTVILTKYSDANLLVVKSKKTKRELLDRTVKTFETANAKITGVIVNSADIKGSGYYGYYSDKYYGGK